MKKRLKAIVIAASAAAIGGIGAVSFAFWSAGGSGQSSAGGKTGNTVETLGNITVAYSNNGTSYGTASTTLTIADKLVPYDQDLTNTQAGHAVLATAPSGESWTNVTYMVFKIANSSGSDTGVTYKIHGSLVNSGGAKLMYKVGAITGRPTGENPLDSWSAMPDTAAPIAGTGFTGDNKVVSVIMVADGVAGKNTDWNITFTADTGVSTDGLAATGYDIRVRDKVAANLTQMPNESGWAAIYAAKGVKLNANDELVFDIKGSSISSIVGAGDKEPTAGVATLTAPKGVKVTTAANYDIYIKYASSETAGTWKVWFEYSAPNDDRVKIADDATTGVYLVGKFEGDPAFIWKYGKAVPVNSKSTNEYMITVTLKVGEQIKIRNGSTGYGRSKVNGEATAVACFEVADSDDNIIVKTAGTFTLYYNTGDNGIWVVKTA